MRRDLSLKIRVRIFRAADGTCSICHGKIYAGQDWDVSHEIPLALGGADDESNMRPAHRRCHKVQTAKIDIPQIAKMKRQEASHIGAKQSSNPLPCGRSSPWKKRFDGSVVRRDA